MNSPFLIAYANPVPVNIRKLKDPLVDMAIIALAGPLCNFFLAIVGTMILFRLPEQSFLTAHFFQFFVIINLSLFLFNMIPIPPLDGSRVLAAIMPVRWVSSFYSVERFGIVIIVVGDMLSRYIFRAFGHDSSLLNYLLREPIEALWVMLVRAFM
jgi:Zn-dependent protease